MDDLDKRFLEHEFTSIGQLFHYITLRYGGRSSKPVHVFVLLPVEGTTVEKIAAEAKRRDHTFETNELSENLHRVTLGVKIRKVEGFLITEKDWWVLISRDMGHVIRSVLIDAFVKNHYLSVLSPAYVDPQEIVEIVLDTSSIYDKIVLDEYSMASERGSLREWLKSGEVFGQELANSLQTRYNSSFTALRVAGISENTDSSKFRIYTESRLCFLSGSFGDFYQFILVPFVRKSLLTNKRYANLERKLENGKVRIFGIKIEGQKSFSKEEIIGVRSFIQESYATFLLYENPVVVLQASDLRDGSSFDIYITDAAINIVPLSRATPGSLVGLCTSIVRRLPPFVQFQPVPPVQARY